MWQDQQVAHSLDIKLRTNDVLTTETVTFEELLLSERILSGLKKSGFHKPSPIQLKAIPLGRCGLDLVVQAKSGTGKTCVFSVIALESINSSSLSLQVVVLAPTREIALQIQGVIACIGQDIPGLNAQSFIGGTLVADDRIKAKKCHIAIGSPGRIKQLIELGILVTSNVQMFVLDEADKLVEEGNFQQQINWIYSSLPENKQVIALSATYPNTLAEFLTRYMREPTYARLDSSDQPLLGLRQYYVEIKDCTLPHLIFERKLEELLRLLSATTYQQALVFSNYHSKAESACDALNTYGWPATYVSGNMTQSRRIEAINKLKLYECRILLSTDLTSRGIDARNVDLVINLDLPSDWETYMHRIGRAGRFGSRGMAISLVNAEEEARLQSWISHHNAPIFLMAEAYNHNGELQSRDEKSHDGGSPSTTGKNDAQLITDQENQITNVTSQDNTQRHNNLNAVKNVDTSSDEISIETDSERTEETSSSGDAIDSGTDSNLNDSFPFSTVNQKSSLPLIPSLVELKERSWHFRANTHCLQMNYEQLKSNYAYFKRTHQFDKPDASLLARLSLQMKELKINKAADEEMEVVDVHATGEDLSADSTSLVKSNTTELPICSEITSSTVLKQTKTTNGKISKEILNTSLPGASNQRNSSSSNQSLQSKGVRRRNPLCGAAAIDILKHWTSVEKVSASKSQDYSPNKEKTNTPTVTSKSEFVTRSPSSCYVIPARRKHFSHYCNSDQEGKLNVWSQSHATNTNVYDKAASNSSSSDESSFGSDESYSDQSSDEYTEDDDTSRSSCETSLTSDDGRKYGPGIGSWQPIDASHHPTSQNSHPIFPPPLLFPFTPTGHAFPPAMHPYSDAKSAQEAYISHQVYQFALQHARKQVSSL